MIAWWEGMGLLGQIFAIIAVPATLILIIQVILSIIGIGGDHDVDGASGDGPDTDCGADMSDDVSGGVYGDTDISHGEPGLHNMDAGVKLITFRGLIAFFAIGGWIGVLMAEQGAGTLLAAVVAVAAGAAALVLVALLFKFIKKLQSDGTADIRNAVGASGTVYLTVPAARAGNGKINVLLQGTYTELDAVTDSEKDIPSGCEITVIGLSGANTVVVKTK